VARLKNSTPAEIATSPASWSSVQRASPSVDSPLVASALVASALVASALVASASGASSGAGSAGRSRRTTASAPPSANSQIRVGMPKNAHGCEACVSQSEAANDSAPAPPIATSSRRVSAPLASGRAPAPRRPARNARSRKSSGHTA
jgi:hypothetical protein